MKIADSITPCLEEKNHPINNVPHLCTIIKLHNITVRQTIQSNTTTYTKYNHEITNNALSNTQSAKNDSHFAIFSKFVIE